MTEKTDGKRQLKGYWASIAIILLVLYPLPLGPTTYAAINLWHDGSLYRALPHIYAPLFVVCKCRPIKFLVRGYIHHCWVSIEVIIFGRKI